MFGIDQVVERPQFGVGEHVLQFMHFVAAVNPGGLERDLTVHRAAEIDLLFRPWIVPGGGKFGKIDLKLTRCVVHGATDDEVVNRRLVGFSGHGGSLLGEILGAKNSVVILSERTEILEVDAGVEMPGIGADIPKRGAKIHRRGALKPDSGRAL